MIWRHWMSVGAAFGWVSGLSLIGVSLHAGAADALIPLAFWPNQHAAGSIGDAARLATAVTGALTAGISTVAWVLRPLDGPPSPASRRAGTAIAVGMAVWFVLDTAASVRLGAWPNVAGNLAFLIALLPPAAALAVGRAGGPPA